MSLPVILSMQFYLDTANVEAIKRFVSWGVVDGVTTNPTLIAKEKASLETRIKEISKIVSGPVSCEVIATDYKGMVEEGRLYATWNRNIYVKLPATEAGLQACHTLSEDGIKVNMTLVFSSGQALLAIKAGAALISPFIGRLDDISEDGMGLIKELTEIFEHYDFKAKILVASIRHPRHVIDAARLGAHIATMPPEVMEKMIKHPLTDKGLAAFLADWEKVHS